MDQKTYQHESAEMAPPLPSVCTIVLNYNASLDTMLKCLDSLAAQTYGNHRILLVDNASTKKILPEVAERYPGVEILALDRNYGFSGGINRGIARAESDWVFILNFDTTVDAGCVAAMVRVASQGPDTVCVAPKMLFKDHTHIFDSIGVCMGAAAGAFNQGIGQPDIGQYDISERVFGACFGAALVRRDAFAPENVGPLDESYFMYFEDIDWCFRANLLGFRAVTAPAAVVYHEHSSSVRDREYSFKYKLIELNLLRTVVRNYQRRQTVRIVLGRLHTHFWNALLPRSGRVRASWAIIARFLFSLPRLVPGRRQIQRRRRVKDLDVLKYAYKEVPYYDPVAFRPLYIIDTLAAAYRRLYILTGDEAALRIWSGLEALNRSKLRFEPEVLSKRLRELLAGQPAHVTDFAGQITADGIQ